MKTWELIITYLSLPIVTSAITIIVTSVINKKKNKAEIDNIVSKTYEGLLKSCLSEIERFKIKLEEIEKQKESSDEENIKLHKELKELRDENKSLKTKISNMQKEIDKLKKP